jgi:hypothetical protein
MARVSEAPSETLTESLSRLAARGYAHALFADAGRLRDPATRGLHDPALLVIAETVRFEGASDPDEQAILFALDSPAGAAIGTYTAVYGPAMPPEDVPVVRRLGAGIPGGSAARKRARQSV